MFDHYVDVTWVISIPTAQTLQGKNLGGTEGGEFRKQQ